MKKMKIEEIDNKEPAESIGCDECEARPRKIQCVTVDANDSDLFLCKRCLQKIGSAMLKWKSAEEEFNELKRRIEGEL
jgi:hypothetical protein